MKQRQPTDEADFDGPTRVDVPIAEPTGRLPRAGRKVTAGDLYRLQTSSYSHVLYCRRCNGEYSAEPSDYFWAKPGHTFKCCKVNCLLLVKT